jgi:hypothetical protein
MRATPAVSLALLIFFALPNAGIEIDPVPTAVLTLMLNTAAFNREIWRAALVDFPREQFDASVSFGMGGGAAFPCIIVPQIMRTCLPVLVNEMSLLIKASPAVAVAGIVDVTRAAVRVGAETYRPLPPLLVALFMAGVERQPGEGSDRGRTDLPSDPERAEAGGALQPCCRGRWLAVRERPARHRPGRRFAAAAGGDRGADPQGDG